MPPAPPHGSPLPDGARLFEVASLERLLLDGERHFDESFVEPPMQGGAGELEDRAKEGPHRIEDITALDKARARARPIA